MSDPITVAIVGSGPAGFYTAEALLRSGRAVAVDIVERLPTPYGLIRGGVAPDHQTTKNVTRKYEEVALDPAVRYFGNVEVGRDVSLDELRDAYDAVVLAIGSPFDRPLGIPGEDKKGVYGAAAFVGWYNAHPDFRNLDPALDVHAAAVIGVGNVAIDVARVLVKTPTEMTKADLPDYAARAIQASPLTDVYMFGRRGPNDAKFTNVELREMGELDNCVPQLDAAQLPKTVEGEASDRDRRLKEKNLATLWEFTKRRADEKPKRVHFCFYAAPVAILGGERVEALRLERTQVVAGQARGTGEFFEVPCGLVLPSIGYRGAPLEGAPFDAKAGIVANRDGRVADGLYAVGWIRRGPTGVIATNRPDGVAAAAFIAADFVHGRKPGRPQLEALLASRRVQAISFAEWKKIEAAEIAAAPPGAPRRKFATVADMLALVDES
ncbi:MAG: pyridine nucleotide-disulfide oxidoreductase [Alphaproteobacteria bacterium]|nr:pyridine nucleotide-disulfide oxidoreductase [Alphaproteobacteria bacterium]